MKKEELKNLLRSRNGYLKSGIPKLVSLFNINYKDAKDAVNEVKEELAMEYIDSKSDVVTSDLMKEFLEWKKINIITQAKSTKVLPKPFLTGDKDNVLVIGDIHEPFCLDGYMEFCREQQEKFNCGTVVFIGDIIDNHASSFHESETEADGPEKELDAAKVAIANWYKVFPVAIVIIGNHDRMAFRKAKSGGVAKQWVRDYSEVLKTPNWTFTEQVIINNVCLNHGEGGTARMKMKNESMSQVQGHLHAQAYIEYSVGARLKIFGFQVGCGVDDNSYAMAYGKHFKKSVISCGVILNKGTLPILITMDL